MIPPTGNVVYAFKIKLLLRPNKLMSGLRSPPSTPTLAPKLGKLPSLPWEPWRDAGCLCTWGKKVARDRGWIQWGHVILSTWEGAGSCGRDMCFRRTPLGMEWHRSLWKATEQPRAFQRNLSPPGLWTAVSFTRKSLYSLLLKWLCLSCLSGFSFLGPTHPRQVSHFPWLPTNP